VTEESPHPSAAGEGMPELTEGLLDEATLDRLFADLAACTRIFSILVKPLAREHVGSDGATTLDQARALLRARTVRGVQVRYRYQDAEWWDTLMVLPQGVRLVRVRQP
jgi:hypothetical protein